MKRLPGAKKAPVKLSDAEGETFFVYEVRPVDARRVYEELTAGLPADEAERKIEVELREKQILSKILPLCSNISEEDFWELYPSEQLQFMEAWKKINAPFWEIVGNLGLQEVVKFVAQSLLNGLQRRFIGVFAGLSTLDTPTQTTTASETM